MTNGYRDLFLKVRFLTIIDLSMTGLTGMLNKLNKIPKTTAESGGNSKIFFKCIFNCSTKFKN